MDSSPLSHRAPSLLAVAREEAERGLSEGGVPVGAALFTREGVLLGKGRNRRVQHGDPSVHGETDAFRNAGRIADYRSTVMVTTLAPCWYCSGLIRQFNIGAVVIGEAETFSGGEGWLAELGVEIVIVDDSACRELMATFIEEHPEIWFEDIGVASGRALTGSGTL